MPCLSSRELVRIALGARADQFQSAHLELCERCQSSLDSIRLLVQRLGHAHTRFNHQHEEARARLLASLPDAWPRSLPAKRWRAYSRTIGAFTMRQKLALGSAGMAAVLTVYVVWFATVAKPIYGMDAMPETIRNAKSYDYAMTTEMRLPGEAGKPPVIAEMLGHCYWVAPGRTGSRRS